MQLGERRVVALSAAVDRGPVGGDGTCVRCGYHECAPSCKPPAVRLTLTEAARLHHLGWLRLESTPSPAEFQLPSEYFWPKPRLAPLAPVGTRVEPGDRVRCIRSTDGAEVGDVLTVRDVLYEDGYFKSCGQWFPFVDFQLLSRSGK
jgi:hypothetical protein